MELTADQKFEKAIQHVIVFAQYMALSETKGGASASDVLMAAAGRAYRAKCMSEGGDQPEEWIANGFDQYMRECVMVHPI
jgi:hypothetical protein